MNNTQLIGSELSIQLFSVFFTLMIGAIIFFIFFKQGFFLRTDQKTSLFIITGKELLLGLLYFFIGQIFVAPALFVIYQYLSGDYTKHDLIHFGNQPFIASLFSYAAGILSVLLTYLSLSSEAKSMFFNHSNSSVGTNFLKGVLYCLVCLPFVAALTEAVSLWVQYIHQQLPLEQNVVQIMKGIVDRPILFLLNAVGIVVSVPICEEFVFRGLLQTWLKRVFNQSFFAIVITSFLFALVHFDVSAGDNNWQILVPLFVVALVLGIAYERTGSLWASIGMHSAFNLTSLLFIFLQVR